MRIDEHERALRGDYQEDTLAPATGILHALGLSLIIWLLIALMMSAAPDFTDSGVGCIDDCLDPAEPIPLEP
jgi:hypothetical protein